MGTPAPLSFVRRHFVTIGGQRQIHYLRGGTGAPVLLLHPSPGPATRMLPVLEYLSPHFTLIAPDTPSNGMSDPLPLDQPGMDDYGDNIARFLDALGIDRIAIYAFHTGASVAAAFATRHPARVRGAILDGFLVETDESLEERLTRYLPPFEPKMDGSHLAWLWSRHRENGLFHKWYEPSLANRRDSELPTPAALHATVMNWLRTGAGYVTPYSAAFRQRGDQLATRFTTPTVICAAESDTLYSHLDRLPAPLPPCVEIHRLGTDANRNKAFFLEQLRRFAGGTAPPPPKTTAVTGHPWHDYVDIGGGQLHVRRSDSGSGRPMVVIHDSAADSFVVNPVTRGFVGKRPVIAIDLPGHGESDNTIGTADVTLSRYAEALGQALDKWGLREIDAIGIASGGSVLAELAHQRPGLVRNLILAGALDLEESARADLRANFSFPIEPDWYGGYLQKAWLVARDHSLFWPWYKRTQAAALGLEPSGPQATQDRLVALMRAGDMFHHQSQAAVAYPLGATLPGIDARIIFAAQSGGMLHAETQRAHATQTASVWVTLPTCQEDWADALLPQLQT